MATKSKQQGWALVRSAQYCEEFDRLPSKHRSQVARKVMDLMQNPRPGGSKTTLVGYDGLCRVRAGDYRIIYAFDDRCVHLHTLKRRTEDTYDHLDDIEIREFEGFRNGSSRKSDAQRAVDWEELAKKWAAPKPKDDVRLPGQVDERLLTDLVIPSEYWPALLAVTTADALLDCEVPYEYRERVWDRFWPRRTTPSDVEPQPVMGVGDLVDSRAAVVCGPIAADDERVGVQGPDVSAASPPSPPFVLASTKELDPMKPYSGNVAKGVARDTSYTVKLDGSVQLLYYVGDREYALLTTDDHPDLVKLVNEAKRAGGSSSGGGRFVIDEYRHVLVPTTKSGVLFAGLYTRDLEFIFEGTTISPVASAAIKPGDVWPGPHVGVRYTLAAGATDVRYEVDTSRGTIRRVQLTDYHKPSALAGLLGMLHAVKPNGGAIYINEAREIFAPVDDGGGYARRYIGHLGDRPWFPEPT